jgi:hypothetical protein
MSALDQAFIKAYAKDGPAPAPSGTAQVAPARPRTTIGSRSAPARVEAAAAAPPIDNAYADGALYRIEVPARADDQTPPPPHYAPPASQHRTTQRRIAGRHRLAPEPAMEVTPPPAEPAAPARRMPTRGLSEVARRLAHYLPPAPATELPPEVVIVEEPSAAPAAVPLESPPAPAPKIAAPVARPAENKAPETVARPALAAPATPVESAPTPSDDVATLVEVCTPWESINDAVSASMVILTDAPFLPASSLAPQVEMALDPIVVRARAMLATQQPFRRRLSPQRPSRPSLPPSRRRSIPTSPKNRTASIRRGRKRSQHLISPPLATLPSSSPQAIDRRRSSCRPCRGRSFRPRRWRP